MPIITKTTKTVYEVNGEFVDLRGLRNYADYSLFSVADKLLEEWDNIPEFKTLDPEHEDAFRQMIDTAINKNARILLGHLQNLVDFMDALDEANDQSGN